MGACVGQQTTTCQGTVSDMTSTSNGLTFACVSTRICAPLCGIPCSINASWNLMAPQFASFNQKPTAVSFVIGFGPAGLISPVSSDLSESVPMFRWLGGRSHWSACTQVHWRTKQNHVVVVSMLSKWRERTVVMRGASFSPFVSLGVFCGIHTFKCRRLFWGCC